jgi:hypothetical protein
VKVPDQEGRIGNDAAFFAGEDHGGRLSTLISKVKQAQQSPPSGDSPAN